MTGQAALQQNLETVGYSSDWQPQRYIGGVILVAYEYDPPLTDDQKQITMRKLRLCLEIREAIWVRTYETADGRRAWAVIRAADAESVRNAHRSAGVPFVAAWPVNIVGD